MYYVRWKIGQPRLTREFPALGSSDHPAFGYHCLLCVKTIGQYRPYWLMAIRPDDDDGDSLLKHQQGRWHTCRAILVHSTCVDGMSWDDLEKIAQQVVFTDGQGVVG